MWSSGAAARDNWERLVAEVIKREEIWQLCHQPSRSPSISTIASSDAFSQRILSFSSINLEPFTVPPSPSSPPNIPLLLSQVSNNAPSVLSTRKVLSGWIPRRKSKNVVDDDIPAAEIYGGLIRYPFRELQAATDNFSNKNILGRGGFGKVYKGRLEDGTLVAIKRLRDERTQGGELQFQTEVEIISRMGGHRNICRLRGFCITSKERILVYPYMSYGSVASCLRDRPMSEPPLSWASRKRIALRIAKGLSYMHEGISGIKIIHRDIKAANILLSDDSEAVIGDFGLAITADHNVTCIEDASALDQEFETIVGDFSLAKVMDCGDTHVTADVRGTIGHIAPEYLATGKISEKTDVFAYGITLLELITGQRAFDLARLENDDVMLLDWVKGLLTEKKLETVVDPNLQGNYVETEVEELMQVALLCTQLSPVHRPKMSEVLRLLEGDGCAERWAEWQNMEVLRQDAKLALPSGWLITDSIEDLNAEELSGPR